MTVTMRATRSTPNTAPGSQKNYYQRAGLNGTLKNTLMDDCLSDAMVYVGRKRAHSVPDAVS